MIIKYIVTYGGLGPNVWNAKIYIDASSVREVLDIAESKIREMGGQVFSVEQAVLSTIYLRRLKK